MFAVSKKQDSLSPMVMKFGPWWIYDLKAFYDFWKQVVQNRENIFVGENIWAALLKAYGLHLFSPMVELIPFAKDFHQFSPELKSKVSDKKIAEVFDIFSHLGLRKVEQLRRFSRDEVQRRFGESWAIFFEGILNNESPWKWHPYREPKILSGQFEFEDFCNDAKLLSHEIGQKILALSKEHPSFRVQKLQIHFTLSQGNEFLQSAEKEIALSFTYEPLLQKDSAWILKLIENQLFEMKFDYPIWKFHLDLHPATAKASYQLSFFNQKHEETSWKELCQKLKDQNFMAFEPAPTFSYLPESSWKKSLEGTPVAASTHGLFRPLIQEPPEKISQPESSLKFTERLRWFDENGDAHERDYFIARASKKWIWVFRNEKHEWFRQGIVE